MMRLIILFFLFVGTQLNAQVDGEAGYVEVLVDKMTGEKRWVDPKLICPRPVEFKPDTYEVTDFLEETLLEITLLPTRQIPEISGIYLFDDDTLKVRSTIFNADFMTSETGEWFSIETGLYLKKKTP